jgi:hypothetical protein
VPLSPAPPGPGPGPDAGADVRGTNRQVDGPVPVST